MKPQSIESCLAALKSAGSVFGVIFTKEDQVLYADVPYNQDRISGIAGVVEDIWFYFKKEKRVIDQVAFGYDGGNLVITTDEAYRLVVLHSINYEIDFIAKASKSFLVDYQMSLFADEFARQQDQQKAIQSVSPDPIPLTTEQVRVMTPQRPGTQRITLKAEQGFDKTEPLQPRVNAAAQAQAQSDRPRARSRK